MISLKNRYTYLAILGLLVSSPAVATVFSIDEFRITRGNGDLVFVDTFGNGIAPPTAPNFANGNAASYFVTGAPGTESGGKYAYDTADGVLVNAVSRPGQNLAADTRLNTNVTSLTAFTSLNISSTFIVTGLFDLSSPNILREGYGLRLSDGGLATTGSNQNDRLDLFVRRTASNDLAIQFRRADVLNDVITTYGSSVLDPLHDQIVLYLSKLDANSKAITASFAYVDGGIVGATTVFGTTADIFNGENYTRASFRATTPVPAPPTVFLALLGLVAMGFARRSTT